MKLTQQIVDEIRNAQLTQRELNILWLEAGKVGRGEIARMLGVSETRVSQIKAQIDKKLKAQGWE